MAEHASFMDQTHGVREEQPIRRFIYQVLYFKCRLVRAVVWVRKQVACARACVSLNLNGLD